MFPFICVTFVIADGLYYTIWVAAVSLVHFASFTEPDIKLIDPDRDGRDKWFGGRFLADRMPDGIFGCLPTVWLQMVG
jgi:hypothetical protein